MKKKPVLRPPSAPRNIGVETFRKKKEVPREETGEPDPRREKAIAQMEKLDQEINRIGSKRRKLREYIEHSNRTEGQMPNARPNGPRKPPPPLRPIRMSERSRRGREKGGAKRGLPMYNVNVREPHVKQQGRTRRKYPRWRRRRQHGPKLWAERRRRRRHSLQ